MIKFEIIDLFCGAGGTTEGFKEARYKGKKICKVIACINHDEIAIQSHSANHKKSKHFIEDIKTFDVTKFPDWSLGVVKILHGSLECTNFSNAKGGLPRDADSRTLANHMFRYIECLNPDYITIENVREFLSWGELDEYGKPISREKGKDYIKWVETVKAFGYDYEYRLLNSADYGAHTSRTRLFIIFAKKGLPIVFPEPTHSKVPNRKLRLKKWKAVKEVLDFSDAGISIFDRKIPLVEKSLERIYAGLVKFVHDDNYIVQYNSGSDSNRCLSVDKPCNTIPTNNRFALVKKSFLYSYISDQPKSVDDSFYTITTQPQHSFVNTEFLLKYYGTGKNVAGMKSPAPTLTTKDRLAKIKPVYFMDHQFSSGQRNKSIEESAGGLTTIPKQNLVKVEKAFLMNRQYNNVCRGIDNPCFTLIASMNKRPGYLVVSELGEVSIVIRKNDSAAMKKIKTFMAAHGIIDIKMRMLKVAELLKIQGFPAEYILKGTEADKKKFIGNSVVPKMAKKIAEALCSELTILNKLNKVA